MPCVFWCPLGEITTLAHLTVDEEEAFLIDLDDIPTELQGSAPSQTCLPGDARVHRQGKL